MRRRDNIVDRIECALEKMRARGMEVRAIYLDEEDDLAYVKANTRYWRKALKSRATFWPTMYGDHPLRTGKTSQVYSTHGVSVSIPKRLSPRVRKAA